MKNCNFVIMFMIIQHQEEIELNFQKYTQSHVVDSFGTELWGSQLSWYPPPHPPNSAKISGQNCNILPDIFMGYGDN